MSLEEIADRYSVRFSDIKPDWNVFDDAKISGYRRAQYRYIGQTLGKPEIKYIPAGGTRLSIMYVPPGEGNAPHTHPVEEVFFILRGNLMVFLEEEDGQRLELNLGPWDCISCPAGVIHGYQNDGVEPVFLQVMVGQVSRSRWDIPIRNCTPSRIATTHISKQRTAGKIQECFEYLSMNGKTTIVKYWRLILSLVEELCV